MTSIQERVEARFVVEVNEGAVEASRQGVEWWLAYRHHAVVAGRLRQTKPACMVGGVAEVACDDAEHAEWLAGHMVEHGGLPRTAVRSRRAAA